MNIYLQERSTGLWLKAPNEYVKDRQQARRFKSSLQAVDFCMQHGVRNVQILICFNDPRFDIVIEPFP